jgi:hypothetical protein
VDAATAAGILGVPLDASRADIEKAFRGHARREHPDISGDPATFARVTEAHDVLVHAAGWARPATAAPGNGHRQVPAPVPPQPGFRLDPYALWLLSGLLGLGALLSATSTTSPLAPVEPAVRSLLLVGSIVGYALTARRGLGMLSALVIVATGVATIVWVSFGTLLGGLLMLPAVVLLVLHGRGRPL